MYARCMTRAGPCQLPLALFLVLLAASARTIAAAAAASRPPAQLLRGAAEQQSAAACTVTISGAQEGGISSAHIICSGGPVNLAVNQQLLGNFTSQFQGVTLQAHNLPSRAGTVVQSEYDCLLTIVGKTDVVFLNSVIEGVRGVPGSNGVQRILCVADSARLKLQHSRISNNIGTGIAAMGSTHVVLNGSSAESNVADTGGAGLRASNSAFVVVLGGSMVADNIALQQKGGGIRAAGSASVVVTGGSIVFNNTSWNGPGGGVALFENASMRIEGGSAIRHNFARGSSGGGVGVWDEATLIVTGGSLITLNTAHEHGGGVYASDSAVVLITGGSAVAGNAALTRSGGGILVRGNSRVTLAEGSAVFNNTASGGGGVSCMSSGAFVATGASVLAMNDPTNGFGGGLKAIGDCVVSITGEVWFDRNKRGNKSLVASEVSLGRVFIEAGRDMLLAENASATTDGSIRGDEGPLGTCSHTVLNLVQHCGPGAYMDIGVQACRCCPPFTFSFDSNITFEQCQLCPMHASCPGGDRVWPVAGYWHSSARSVQIHQCPMHTAACGDKGECEPGYMGHLCGSCKPGYGMTLAFRCSKCMFPAKHLGLYVMLTCITVAFVTGTVYFTWHENCQGGHHVRASDLIKVLVQYLQYLMILGTFMGAYAPSMLRVLFTASTSVFGAASGQAFVPDCWMSEYLDPGSDPQHHLIPVGVRAQLFKFVAPVVVFFAVLFVTFAGHAVAAVVWHVVRHRCRCCSAADRHAANTIIRHDVSDAGVLLLRRLPVIAIVVLFYGYPTLVKTALAFFACLRIDDSHKQPYAQFAVANATKGYWTLDPSQECFTGWHRTWALACGLPLSLLLCVVVPFWLFLFLHLNMSNITQRAFQQRYGFLYRNYKASKAWWEAVWAVQTVLLSAVTVFQFSIEAYSSILLFSVLFVGSAVLQAVVKPYAEPRLHYLQLVATGILFLTAQSTLTLFHPYADNTAASVVVPKAVGSILVILNGLFVLWCLALIAVAAFKPGRVVCMFMGRWCHCLPPVLPRVPQQQDNNDNVPNNNSALCGACRTAFAGPKETAGPVKLAQLQLARV